LLGNVAAVVVVGVDLKITVIYLKSKAPVVIQSVLPQKKPKAAENPPHS
jgi:hypothetical protein